LRLLSCSTFDGSSRLSLGREGIGESRSVVDAEEKKDVAGVEGEIGAGWNGVRVAYDECDPRSLTEREVVQAAAVGR
jgi:hypothetical protein